MLPAMAAKTRIGIVGPGRLGTALALELNRAGYTIAEIISREPAASRKKAHSLARRVRSRARTMEDARLDAGLIWFCVPDRQIAPAARALVRSIDWSKKVVFHSSGALTSDELGVLRRHGAA